MLSEFENRVQERAASRELRDLRPDEVVGHRFGWRVPGISVRQARRLVLEVAAELDDTRRAWAVEVLECRRLERALAATMPAIQELRAQLTAVRKQLHTCTANAGHAEPRDANARLAGARLHLEDEFLAAASRSREGSEAAGREVGEIAAAARLMAAAIIRDAQQTAAETLRSARAVAHMRLRAAGWSVPWRQTAGDITHEEFKRSAQTAVCHLSDLIARVEAMHRAIGGRARSAVRGSRASGTPPTRRSPAATLDPTGLAP